MNEKSEHTAGRYALGLFALEFADHNDDVLFGENSDDRDIDLKALSIITRRSLV